MNTFVLYFHDDGIFERARRALDVRNLQFLLNNIDPIAGSDIALIRGFCVDCDTFKQFNPFLKDRSYALLVTEATLDTDLEEDKRRAPVLVRAATLDELCNGFCLD